MMTILTLGFATDNGEGAPISSIEEFETRTAAEQHLRRHVATFEAHGYNRSQNYWWARSKRDKYKFRRFHIQEKAT
jgi:hypothetical protein